MRTPLLLLLLATFTSSCDTGIHGHGKIITEKRNVTGFHSISTDAVAEIILIQDSSSYVEVNSYENLVPLIETTVENSNLHIDSRKQISMMDNDRVKVTIHAPSLDEMSLSGVGSIKTEKPFHFNSIDMTLSGVGSINIDGDAHVANLINSGAGSIDIKGMNVDSVYATNSGVGSIRCAPIKYLKAIVSGVGSISYSGNPVVDKTVSGVGSIHKE
ncbi:MAG: GIN domain-containing protein [Chitinophagales bacterium]